MKFAVETWSTEYSGAADAGALDDAAETVDVTVERPPSQWEPIDPAGAPRPSSIIFVDGIRRIDARVWVDDGGVSRAGVCASVAAGAVRCDDTGAHVIDQAVFRGMFATASGAAGPIVTRHGTYEFVPCAGESSEDLYLAIHSRMTDLEGSFEFSRDEGIVVFDGPLRHRDAPNGVGYVKTQHVQYLPGELQPLLGRLGPGHRTPVFLIGGRFTRWSWYLRLPGPVAHPLSGIVRCELRGVGTVADAIEQADQVTAALPRFASRPHKDPRAPQNLYPIAGLERQLRRRLGDQLLLERGLRIAAAVAAAA